MSIIDFGLFLDGTKDEKLQISKEMTESIRTSRYVYLKNYGISDDIYQKMCQHREDYFKAPIDEKLKGAVNDNRYVGYYPFKQEQVQGDYEKDLREAFLYDKLEKTPWINEEFKDFMLDFHQRCYHLAFQIVRSFALGLNIDEKEFQPVFDSQFDVIRLNHYPPVKSSTNKKNEIRCTEHTDYGCLSFIFQDSQGGLQIQDANKIWQSAPTKPDTIVMFVGDCMEHWTSGYLKAAPHRVINSDEEDILSRYTTVFFTDPVHTMKIEAFNKFKDIKYEGDSYGLTFMEHVKNSNKFNVDSSSEK